MIPQQKGSKNFFYPTRKTRRIVKERTRSGFANWGRTFLVMQRDSSKLSLVGFLIFWKHLNCNRGVWHLWRGQPLSRRWKLGAAIFPLGTKRTLSMVCIYDVPPNYQKPSIPFITYIFVTFRRRTKFVLFWILGTTSHGSLKRLCIKRFQHV